eukprot:scaffold205189_cov21-Prasinocladus_malaysianus.AAC.1
MPDATASAHLADLVPAVRRVGVSEHGEGLPAGLGVLDQTLAEGLGGRTAHVLPARMHKGQAAYQQ